ncbi:MAG: hypothetical protein L0H93_17630 [Nocardioides sp.]|nr:hypothetical protein [Nocardioides sp.]
MTAQALATVAGGVTTVRRDTQAALAATGMAILKRPSVPVLGGVMVTSLTDETIFETFDYDTAVRVSVPSTGAPGQWLVPHEELTRLLTAAGKGERKADADAMPVTVSTDPATDEPILSAAGFSIPLTATLDPEKSPAMPPRPERVTKVDRAAFAEAVKRVMAACGVDDMLPVLTGVRMVVGDGAVRMETTDRFRVTLASVPVSGPSTDAAVLVPGKKLQAAMKHLTGETITIYAGSPGKGADERMVLRSDRVEVSTRGLAGEFPKVRSLVPTEATVTATVNVGALTKAAQKAHAMSTARNGTQNIFVSCAVSPTGITVAPVALHAAGDVNAPEVPADVGGDLDGHFLTGFNPKFLLDLLAGFTQETVTLHFTTPTRPITATDSPDGLGDPEAFKHLLMPRRLPS